MSFDLSSESLLPILKPLFLGGTKTAASAWALSLLSTILAVDTTGCALRPAAPLLGGPAPWLLLGRRAALPTHSHCAEHVAGGASVEHFPCGRQRGA